MRHSSKRELPRSGIASKTKRVRDKTSQNESHGRPCDIISICRGRNGKFIRRRKKKKENHNTIYNIVSDCGLQLFEFSCLSGYEPCALVAPNFLSLLLSLDKIFLLNLSPPICLQTLLLPTSCSQNTKPTCIASRPLLEPTT